MAIEIRHLVIKSTVLQSGASENGDAHSNREDHFDTDTLKQEILTDCRTLLLEMFQAQKER